jgi:glycosyltransferase involved in cell wall biosynthesis
MAAYNAERFISDSIKSILNQTFKDFELIIINDKSTDKTLSIIKEFQEKDKRIKLISNKKNQGPASSRNNGILKASGEFIAILDSDDLAHEKRLEIEYSYLKSHKCIFLVGSSTIFINEKGEPIAKYRKFNMPQIISWRLPKSCGIIHSTVMFRNTREFFYDINFPCAQDYNLYLDMISRGKRLTNLPNFLCKYRVSEYSISVSKRDEQIRLKEEIQRRYKYLEKNTS